MCLTLYSNIDHEERKSKDGLERADQRTGKTGNITGICIPNKTYVAHFFRIFYRRRYIPRKATAAREPISRKWWVHVVSLKIIRSRAPLSRGKP